MGKRIKKSGHVYFISFDNLIAFFVIAGFLTVIITQVLMLNDNIRVFLNSTEKIEGININTYLSKDGTLKLELVNMEKAQNAYVLINGDPKYSFKNKSVDISIKQGELIEIDGTKYKQTLYIKVADSSDNVIEPQRTAVVKVNGDIEVVGRVRLK
ncbi:hypothetical protein [Thermoanaerobacterium thermosaccharolyticum]|uniref:Uncharacterized protein n=1 Tax=Thermoanaerobacterium thermosaccharolyticum M0795 TaxID=698948 RepID=L0IL63_THETR|nr:hypothetical protein [Thermoanaerobacterium thermosaccharolyticum]AGB18966.1 hypothetical protein Thethe_01324 [Thermoanaerobacterium thermosaccharolyticum M0795]TCW37205.1 hypothetical protein EDC21_1086 [Thermohydrogenium kirishiense]